METTKITIRLHRSLYGQLSEALDSRFFKRDAFLNNLISVELPKLREELDGLKQSVSAKRYVRKQLDSLDLHPVNIVVDKSTSHELSAIAAETNMVRDAFVNRLVLFLLAPKWLLNSFEIPEEVNENWARRQDLAPEPLPTDPLWMISESLADPFRFYRQSLAWSYEDCANTFYRLDLHHDSTGPTAKLAGFSCYLPDDQVPDTDPYRERLEDEEKVSKLLSLDDFLG